MPRTVVQKDAQDWNEPWATVSLEPGAKAEFTLTMTDGQGLVRSDFEKASGPPPAGPGNGRGARP